MDVCVVIFRNDASCIASGLRPNDRLLLRDNTADNIGFAAGANAAAAQGDGRLILFVNPDGRLGPGALDSLERVFDDPAVVAAEASQGPEWDRGTSPEWLSGACLAVRREAFEAVGGFDERLFMYAEDVDLSYKLAARGRLVHVAGACFVHDHSSRRSSWVALHRNFRNWLVVQRRHRSADPSRMLRDAAYALRQRQFVPALARVTGTVDYLARGRRWR
jgi:GT2 family glycosyltransferase